MDALLMARLRSSIAIYVTVVCIAAAVISSGCGSSGATGGTSADTTSVTGTVQAPTIGIFGNVAVTKGLATKALAESGIGNAAVCAYNLVTGDKVKCTTTDSSGNYTLSGLNDTAITDPNHTSQVRLVIETTSSDGQATFYDYEDRALASSMNAGTTNNATTNAFVAGPLGDIREVDATWKPGNAPPASFTDRLKAASYDPACEFAPYAATFTDNNVAVGGSGVGGSLGVVNDMLKAALGRTVWKTLGYSHEADFVYDALHNKLTSSQISTWATAVASDIGTTAATLENSFSTAMSTIKSLETVFSSVLAADVGLSSRSGRSSTFCARIKSDTTAQANWVDTLVQYGSTSLLEKHWGTATVFSAAAKFVEESDDDDIWSAFQPGVVIGLLGDSFDAAVVTNAIVNTAILLMTKGRYTSFTEANKQDIGTDLWEILTKSSAAERTTMEGNPAFWIGYLENYFAELTSSTNYAKLVDDIIDDADDVAVAPCESDPKACATTAGAETPSESAIPNIAGNYAATFGSATSNTCAATNVSCTAGTLTLAQSTSSLTCTLAPTSGGTHLTGTGTASTSSWSCTIVRSGQTRGSCEYSESVALSGTPSPLSAKTTTVTYTRSSTSTASQCLDVINASLADAATSCSFSCSTTLQAK